MLLAKGLKFIPNQSTSNTRKQLLQGFDEFARKMRCRFHFHNNNNDKIHPFRIKSFYNPSYTCHELENYLDLTKLDISHMQLKHDNKRSKADQLKTLKSLQN